MNHDDLVIEFLRLRDEVENLREQLTELKQDLEAGAYDKPES